MTALHQLRDVVLRPAGRLTRRSTLSQAKTILIFQPDHLGDILLSQPAVNRIRKTFPDHQLIGVVGPWSESIARLTWPVDDIVTVDFPGFNRRDGNTTPIAPYLQLREDAALLHHFDASPSFVLRPDAWWAGWLATLVTGGPVVTSNDPGMIPFGSHRAPVSNDDHVTIRAITIAEALGQPLEPGAATPQSDPLSIPVQPEARAAARQILRELGVAVEYIVIHPGAGADVKLWPEDRWRKVASELASSSMPIVVTGTESEAALVRSIASSNANVISLAGETPLPVLIEILRGARLVLGPDSGPLHLAVACDTPTVHLFGPSDPARYGPWGSPDRHRVITSGWSCSRCGDLSSTRPSGCGCMTSIEPRTVLDVANNLLGSNDHQ